MLIFAGIVSLTRFLLIGTASANSVESDLGCTSRIYFDNVTLTYQKPCQHDNKCDCSKTNGYKCSLCFFNKISLFEKYINLIYSFGVIRKWILVRLNPHATELIYLTPVLANKMKPFRT